MLLLRLHSDKAMLYARRMLPRNQNGASRIVATGNRNSALKSTASSSAHTRRGKIDRPPAVGPETRLW